MRWPVCTWLIPLLGAAAAWNPLPAIPSSTGLEVAEQGVFQGVNRERARAGLPSLILDARLSAAARLHAKDMAQNHFFSHTNPKPGFATPTDRIHQAGSLDWSAGENIAFNEEAVNAVADTLMTQWMNSPPHRANILARDYTHIGVGVYRDAQGRSYGVQDFVQRPFEVSLEVNQRALTLRNLEWRGRINGNRELALFRGQEFLGALPVSATGNFAAVVPFEAAQAWRIGSRAPGASGAYLIVASLQTPAAFRAGALSVNLAPSAPINDSSAALTERSQFSTVLELRFSGNKVPVVVLERIGNQEQRVTVRQNTASVVCPVGLERRALRLAMGAQTYSFTHRFVLDCQTGQVTAGGEP